jgi:multidrug efflux system outer membrane protein
VKAVRTAALLAALGALFACAVGPSYERPDTVLPEAYRGQAQSAQAVSLADLGWWELYQDPRLAELIRTALDQNLDLQIAVARVEEARARARAANADFFPSVGGTLSTAASPAAVSAVPGAAPGSVDLVRTAAGSSYTGGAQLSWELDFFGRVRRSSQAARADLLASEEGRKAAVSSLVAQVASTYFQLRVLDAQREVTLETIASDEASLKLVRAQMRGGVASATEEQQALGQLASVRAQLPGIEQQIAEAENQLSVLLGRHPGAVGRPRGDEGAPVPVEIPAGLPSELLERRPDIRQAEEQLAAATARIGVARAQTFPFPRIFLTAFAGAVSGSLSALLKGNGAGMNSWGPGVTWPLLDLSGRANVGVAEAQTKQAALAYQSAILNALREVADSLSALQTVRAQIEQQEIRVKSGQEYARLTNLRYQRGVSSYLEVLDAQRQYYSAQIDYQSARLTQLQALVQLYKALGGGWSDAPPQPSPSDPQEAQTASQ